jgi:peroxisome proliferator-activated receptor gamma coactivator-related protein 1
MSLLTALTEILDNADSENLSPFDSIPDSELLVSPREGSVSVEPGREYKSYNHIFRPVHIALKHKLISGLFIPLSCTSCSHSLGHPQNVTSSPQLTHWDPAQAVLE